MSKRTLIVGSAGAVGVAWLAAARCRPSAGRLSGLMCRATSRHPDEDVRDLVLADRIRSSIGPLERHLDLPHIHVVVHDHIATLRSGVSVSSDTRPFDGRAVRPTSAARSRLLAGAREAGARYAPLFAVHAVLWAFLELIARDERAHVFAHLPHDVRSIPTTPQHLREHRGRVRSVDELVAVVAASDPQLHTAKADTATGGVLDVLRELVPEERDDIAAAPPRELRAMWRDRCSQARA